MKLSTAPPQYATDVPPLLMKANGEWSTGLFDCGSDTANCFMTCCCPCVYFGQIGEILDKGTHSWVEHCALYSIIQCFTGYGSLYSFMYRSELREQYKLPEEPCNDFCVHCFCECCAISQEYRELKHRGFDPSLGWHRNIEKHNKGVEMPPIGPGEMER